MISLLVSGAVAEPPAPYAPSGWRPSGPAFELPQPGQAAQQQVMLKNLFLVIRTAQKLRSQRKNKIKLLNLSHG